MSVCLQCHSTIHSTFSKTGMGQSFGQATKTKSVAELERDVVVTDTSMGFRYSAFWKDDSLIIRETSTNSWNQAYHQDRKISYIIGSGQHTNSHLILSNGYLYQAAMTYYSQSKTWDLPPGFENGNNTRFGRIIGVECMSCHNGIPSFVQGSENKYNQIPLGIDCERCHGPGEIHVREKQKGILVDTSKYVDFSIVNPAKLPIDRQFDVCQRCHLQGNTILKGNQSFLDFKPGMKLSSVMEVYLPRYSDSDESFIMASHADRLKQSKCFIEMAKSSENEISLRPYKNALTCVTCHNPHVSVKESDPAFFTNKCKSCHQEEKQAICSESLVKREEKSNNCVTCHMSVSGSSDIPHVRIHDHYIRKPIDPKSKAPGRKQFLNLECVNCDSVSEFYLAKAYLQQFEKFDPQNVALLSRASEILGNLGGDKVDSLFSSYIQLYYLSKKFSPIADMVNRRGHSALIYFDLIAKNLSNSDAWTSYRIGEAFLNLGKTKEALAYYYVAHRLAPYYFEFTNKYGASLIDNHQLDYAFQIFSALTKENPEYESAWSNMAYLQILRGNYDLAEDAARRSIELNPNYIQARMNLAQVFSIKGDTIAFENELNVILTIDPTNVQAKLAYSKSE